MIDNDNDDSDEDQEDDETQDEIGDDLSDLWFSLMEIPRGDLLDLGFMIIMRAKKGGIAPPLLADQIRGHCY